ncbi:MAG: CapA family protein, partial [Thermomicrobiaceae bacterium]|nr:CapA family protein [Thermomicrobiaceae bacterium]
MSRPVTLAIAGDVMLGRLVNEVIAREGFAYPWDDLIPTLREVDAFLINLECALTSRTERWHDGAYKAFYFRAEPAVVETLRIGRVDFACLANTHIGDFGLEGLLETVAVLDRAGIAHAGAGADPISAAAPARLTVGGWRIAILAYADYPEEWAAAPGRPGIN